MKFKNTNFPTVAEIRQAAQEYVDKECAGEWPEDSWFDFGERWSINIWEEEIGLLRFRHIAVYPDRECECGKRHTDTDCAIHIE